MMEIIELGERVVEAIYAENSGNLFHRIGVIEQRALDAIVFGAVGR